MAVNYNVQWISSQKGQSQLVIDSYMFQSNGKGRGGNNVRYWKCADKGCDVTARTDGNNVLEVKGLVNPPDHGHPNNVTQLQQHHRMVRKN